MTTGSKEAIAEQIFDIIKGFGHSVLLYTQNGKETPRMEEAVSFFLREKKIMVNLVIDESISEISINLSAGIDLTEIKPMLTSLRTLANRYIIEYTVKTFGKQISPKDFAYQAKAVNEGNTMNNVNEGFSGWHGSARKSINELGNAKIIVRHRRTVDEEKRGARTRQVESIFIENSEGERFKFPTKNITAAKAMLRHVKEGGAPFDNFGQHIYSLMEELDQLKRFNRQNKRNGFFEDANVSNEITMRIESLRGNLKQISGIRGYQKHFESFKTEDYESSRKKLEELKKHPTVTAFDENISGSIPYVAQIIENLRSRQGREQEIIDLARYVQQNQDNIQLNSPIDNSDPDSPATQSYKEKATEVVAWVSYLAPKVQDDVLSNHLMRTADMVVDVHPDHVKLAMAAINVIRKCCSVAESIQIDEKKSGIYANEMSKVLESFKKYDIKEIFQI